MQLVRKVDHALPDVGCGLQVLFLAAPDAQAALRTQRHLVDLGTRVERQDELYAGLEAVLEDPRDYGAVVMDCDAFGGIAAGIRAFHLLVSVRDRLPVILISSDVDTPVFPDDRRAPTIVPAPASPSALHAAVRHAFRARLEWRAA
jgi:hypothetical protein